MRRTFPSMPLLAFMLAAVLVVALQADSTEKPQGRDPTFTLDDDDGYDPNAGNPGGPGGDGTDAIPAGTFNLEWEFQANPETRWDAVKQTLMQMFQGYVNGDLNAFMSGFSGSMSQDVSIFRNAASGDFQRDTSINVDIQILEYRVNFDQICTRFLWNRNAVDQKTGVVGVQTGETYSCFNRHDGFKVSLMTGQVPFGAGDPQLQTQLQAGQPNDPGANSATPSPSPTTPAPPPMANNGPFSRTLMLSMSSGGNNAAALDLENESYQRFFFEFNTGGSAMSEPSQAGEDFYVWLETSGEGDQIFYQGVAGTTVLPCSGSTPTIANVRDILGGGATGAQTGESVSHTFGLVAPGGTKALAVLSGKMGSLPNIQVNLTYVRNPSGSPVVAGGTVDCSAGFAVQP